MKANFKTIIIGLTTFVAGYALGNFLEIPRASNEMGSGDISKVSKYYKETAAPMSNAYREKLLNDAEALEEACISMEILSNRMYDFSALVNKSIEVTEGKAEFESNVNNLKSVKTLSDNAVEAGRIASASFQSLVSGENNDLAADYEQVAQNLAVAYLMVDRQVELGKEFVASADLYLRRNSIEDNTELALLRDLWAKYCAGSAYLNNDKEELAYWDKKECLLSSDQVSKVLNSQVQKEIDNQAQKLYSNMAQQHVEQMTQKHVDNQAQKTFDNMAQKHLDSQAQYAMSNLTQKTNLEIAQKVTNNTVQKLNENQAQKTIDNQAQKVTNNTAQMQIDNNVQKVVTNLVQKTFEEMTQKK